MSDRKRITVGLPWHSINSSNLGLGALTECQLDLLQAAADDVGLEVRFEVLFWPDRTDAYVERPNLHFCAFGKGFLLAPKGGLLSYARRCDVIVDIAGGDSFTDKYGVRRFLFQSLTKCAAVLTRTPLILSPQTLGPFERRWCRWLAGWIMRRARHTISRDDMSSALARELGAERRLIEATDVAFRLPYSPPAPRTDGTPGASGTAAPAPLRVGVNVSGLLYGGGYDRQNYFGLSVDYVELIHDLLDRLTARDDVEVHLIGHVLVPLKFESVEDDLRVAIQLGENHPSVVVAPAFRTPSEAKSYIAGTDLFMGSRMHACIAAFSSGVPVVPLAYSRKFKGLFGTLGYPLVADCLTETKEQILAKVDEGLGSLPSLRDKVARGNERAVQKLERYDEVVRACFRNVGGLDSGADRKASP
ncbi:MAG: polysaccharide pyruvyl transferase family protein [Planctomycetota bacterium]